jgi:hypothetical protein
VPLILVVDDEVEVAELIADVMTQLNTTCAWHSPLLMGW